MEMREWHTFFRNSIPGYFFMLSAFSVLLACYIDPIGKLLGAVDSAGLGIAAIFSGYPLGNAIYWIYRWCWHSRIEKAMWDKQRDEINRGEHKLKDGESLRRVVFSGWYHLNALRSAKEMREWLMSHFSIMHSLRASMFGVIFGLAFGLWLNFWPPIRDSAAFLNLAGCGCQPCVFLIVTLTIWAVLSVILFCLAQGQQDCLEERISIYIRQHMKCILDVINGKRGDIDQCEFIRNTEK